MEYFYLFIFFTVSLLPLTSGYITSAMQKKLELYSSLFLRFFYMYESKTRLLPTSGLPN